MPSMLQFTASLGWRDLRDSGRSLWVFGACLTLGVMLIAASGGLFRQVSEGLLADTRTLFGGDLEVRSRSPVSPDALRWMRERSDVSLLIELRTMLLTAQGRPHLVELQSFDDRYPLYGEVILRPDASLSDALSRRAGVWGVAIDPVLADRLALEAGDDVELGDLRVEVRALIERQPDRSLRADWRGPPVLIAAEALSATALVQPGSRLAYRYRVKTEQDADAWRSELTAAFPATDWEIRTFQERSERLSEVLGQIGSGLLLIGFSALFIGGLGVFNSVNAYLQSKLASIATLQAMGLRDRSLAAVYVFQILLLAGAASIAGALAGGGLALAGIAMAAERLPVAPTADLLGPLAVAWVFGVLTALTFALPALGRALSVPPAVLFRGIDTASTRTPALYWWLTTACAVLTLALVLVVLPQPAFAIAFVIVVATVLALLEITVRLLRSIAHFLADHRMLAGHFALRLALANLYRPGSALRSALLSLGSALTLLVASALVVAALLRTLNETIPEHAPALVFYDISAGQVGEFRALLDAFASLERLDLAPLVLGRLSHLNGKLLRDSADEAQRLEARDEHKLSYRMNNFDNVVIDRGAWWRKDYRGPPLVAMEDREADQIGLRVGDRLGFEIQGRLVEAELAAIYSQRRFQARFWLEAIFSDDVLDPFVTRYVGAAYLDRQEAAAAHNRIAATAPNIVTVRTEGILNEARALLERAGAALGVISAVTLTASLLVLVSIVVTSRVRHMYDATVLHTLGTRFAVIRRSLQIEYALLAIMSSVFALGLGGAIAVAFLNYRLELAAENVWWVGVATAIVVSTSSLGLGAWYLLRQLRLAPALLLRTNG